MKNEADAFKVNTSVYRKEKQNMKQWLSITLVAGLLLYPLATFGTDYRSQTSQTQRTPPVAQTLVREGDFAIKLATRLHLGKPDNEAVAEEMLAKAGVTPLSGWISDYPVTPEIVAQLKDSVTKAAHSGRLPMTSGEATERLYRLTAELSLPIPANPRSSGTSPTAGTDPAVIDNYYYDEGPPVVTYYPPPADYLYLYDWVPFPVFWFGFWFPGFFICNNFTTVVFVRTPIVTTRSVFVTRSTIVSNVVIDPVTRTAAVVDPVVRTNTGAIQPVTALRTGNGRMFSTVTDLRRGTSMGNVSAVRTQTAEATAARSGRFSSPEARRSAQNILARNGQAASARSGTGGNVPRAPARSFHGPVPRGGSSPMRWFNGHGWHGRE